MRQSLILLAACLALAACDDIGSTVSADLSPFSSVDDQTGSAETQLAPGQMARVCDLDEATLGTMIASAAGHSLYDTGGGSVEPRTHYLTGFPDDCARQFTAALAMFGDIATHEGVRYQESNADLGYSASDTAYEEIKAQVCGVPSGTPCGGRLEQLGRNTVFVTIYERFGTNPTWTDVLIHDGQVVSMDAKGN